MTFSALISLVVCGGVAGAAVPSLKTVFMATRAGKRNAYHRAGVFTGGTAGNGSSIVAVRRSFSRKSALERVAIELGDKDAKPAGERMGFFQAALDPTGRRLTVDVSQLRLSKVSEAQVRRVFRGSPLVRNVNYTLDPEDNAATMVFELRRPVGVEVYRAVKRGARAEIVLDLRARKVR